jgi:hypothetical protein
VTIGEPKRNLDQNARLHALLADVSKSVKWAGKEWDVDTWKRLLVASWMRTKGKQHMVLPAIDGNGIEVIYQNTSTLGKSDFSELMDYIESWHADICTEAK